MDECLNYKKNSLSSVSNKHFHHYSGDCSSIVQRTKEAPERVVTVTEGSFSCKSYTFDLFTSG